MERLIIFIFFIPFSFIISWWFRKKILKIQKKRGYKTAHYYPIYDFYVKNRATLSVFIILLVLYAGYGIYLTYLLDSNFYSWAYRAQVAGNADELCTYLGTLMINIENEGLTSGYAALIWKTPESDMSLIYTTLTNVKNRGCELKELDSNSDAYQQGMDDIRGRLGDLDIMVWPWFAANRFPYFLYHPLSILMFLIVEVVLLFLSVGAIEKKSA